MKLFISYPSGSRTAADRLRLALEAEGHETFFDRSDLRSGEYFHQTLRQAIDEADAFIFLITPRSVAQGSYCMTELALAEQRWRRPGGHVLPVMLEATPMAQVPPYLQAVTVLQPSGDLVAETVAAVARLSGPSKGRRPLFAALGLAALVAVGGGVAWKMNADKQAAQQAYDAVARQQTAEALASAEYSRYASLCAEGSHATAWAGLMALPEPKTARTQWREARESCAMSWVREASVISGQQTFTQLVAPLKVVLAAGLASGASGVRAADLRAHLGWAEHLEKREGQGRLDPSVSYRRALEDDPGNVYAQAMWGHNLLYYWTDVPAGKERLNQAMAGSRERAFAQGLALRQALEHDELHGWAMQIASQMRQQGTTLPPATAQRFWSRVFALSYRPEHAARWMGAVPAAEGLKTFEWLQPEAQVREDQRDLWRYVQARLRIEAGQRDAAREQLQALQQRFKNGKSTGGLPDAVKEALEGLVGLEGRR